MVDSLAQRVLECDAKTEALLAALGRHEVELGGPGKRRGKNTPGFDARTALARWAGVDLTRINGLAVTTVMTILSEIGPDLSRFANVKQFCSWLGLCPGTKVSGGKVLSARTRRSTNRVRQALKLAAMSLSRNDSALGAFYRRLCARMEDLPLLPHASGPCRHRCCLFSHSFQHRSRPGRSTLKSSHKSRRLNSLVTNEKADTRSTDEPFSRQNGFIVV